MAANPATPWHKASFDRFLNERLPELLAARLPLADYCVEAMDGPACRVTLALASASGNAQLHYDVPQPDTDGVFVVAGTRRVVVPLASTEDIDVAEIRCVGEQLYEFVEERLGEAPSTLPWDAALARAWLPLDALVVAFLKEVGQALDGLNWLARHTHLRRLAVPARRKLVAHGQFGRVCPFETPEGPNIGKVFTVALGAEVRDGKLVVLDDRPEAGLGLSASMVPFLEHSDANRVLMGVNMMRQQLVPPDPEPALVQTGNEPCAPDFWCGRNLLTAFVSWGVETFEDAIAISESAAKRLDFPHPIEPGDKLANRHGTKGTVSRVLPDDEMPHLPDGTPVELCFSFIGCHTRLNFGQIREAVMGRIARAEGKAATVPPFHAPSQDELRERLQQAGLPDTGMEMLTLGKAGPPLERPSTVGWVYWGKLNHRVADKLRSWPTGRGQWQGELEYYALRNVGAFETIAETFNTRSAERPDADTLADRVAAGPVEQAPPPTPAFAELRRRLATAGIAAELEGGRVSLHLAAPDDALRLAQPVPHPWLPEREVHAVAKVGGCPEFAAVAETNARLERMVAGNAPASLTRRAAADLAARVRDLFETLVPSAPTEPEARMAPGRWSPAPPYWGLGNRVLFSGRSVLSPAPDLRVDQLGLAEELAWALFGPLVIRELGSRRDVQERAERATAALDAIMKRSWVLVNRAPTIMPTAILAFHPVRCPDRAIRLHPLTCMFLNADFDGDQAAVLLPITEAGQREAAEKLSVAGHLRRDPDLLKWLMPSMASLWGLASLSRTAAGLSEVAELAGANVAAPDGFVTKASLLEAMRGVLGREGAEATLDRLDRLMRRGFEVAKASGASLSPFVGRGLDHPSLPEADDPAAWMACAEDVADRIAASTAYDSGALGPQLLAVKCGARGHTRQLAILVGPRGVVVDASGHPVVPVRHSLCQGMTPQEAFACVVGAREGLGRTALECARTGYDIRDTSIARGFHVLARAVRATRPGVVFARAAAVGENDPLTELDSRLFVGLPPQ